MQPRNENINDMSPRQLTNYIKTLDRSVTNFKEKNEDLMATLFINKQLLDVTLEKRCENMPCESQARVKSSMVKLRVLEETNSKLFQQNFTLYEQLLSSAKMIEGGECGRKDEIAELENKNSTLTAMWSEKEKRITTLKTALKNAQHRKVPGIAVQEKHILDPTQQTLVMHNELQINKTAFKKLNKKMSTEVERRGTLLKYNKQIKQRNEQLKTILKNIIANNGNLSENSEGLFKSLDLEKIKSVLENDISEPLMMERADELKKADTSMNLPSKAVEPDPSVASSIGSPLPAKNDLSKSHDRIKPFIPMLDFSKIKGRADLKKIEKVGAGIPNKDATSIQNLEIKKKSSIAVYGQYKRAVQGTRSVSTKKQ